MTPDTQHLLSFLELRIRCGRARSTVQACFWAITHLFSAAQRSRHIVSLEDSGNITCFVIAVEIGVITRTQDLMCGTGSAQHKGGHCSKS